jgi:hypothetical protein
VTAAVVIVVPQLVPPRFRRLAELQSIIRAVTFKRQ